MHFDASCRFENMSSPVWVISSFINCASSGTCFSNCYGDPTEGNDLSSRCVNDFVSLNCGKSVFVVCVLNRQVTCTNSAI